MRFLRLISVAALGVAGLVACSASSAKPVGDPVGTLVWTTIDVEDEMEAWEAGFLSHGDSHVVTTRSELATFRDLMGAGETDSLGDIVMDENDLLVGAYYSCFHSSEARQEEDGDYRFVVVGPEQEIDCDYSPYTVDVWLLPQTD